MSQQMSDNMEKTDNEWIAEFMDGFRLKLTGPRNMWYIKSRNETVDVGNMLYDKSWDWLHPVIDKIKQIYNENESKEIAKLMLMQDIFATGIFIPIEVVYKRVVDFIKWYQTQNP